MIATPSVEIEFLPSQQHCLDHHHVDSLHNNPATRNAFDAVMDDNSTCVSASNHSYSSHKSMLSGFRPSLSFFNTNCNDNDDGSSVDEFATEEELPQDMDIRENDSYHHHRRRGTFVRFASDEKGRLLTEYFPFKKYGRNERKNIWYRSKDFKSFANRAQTKASNSQEYLKMVADMRIMCQSADKLRNRAELLQQFCMCVAESPFRGLEPFLDGTHERRKQVIQSVLDEQDQWLALGSILTEEERVTALGDHCRSMTKSHRRVAHLMATGDAMVAKGWVKSRRGISSSDRPDVVDQLEI